MSARYYLGVDVGTGSVRAALFDGTGLRSGLGVSPIQIWRPSEDFVEQSSEDIWRAAGIAIRAALTEAGAGPEEVVGIGFDATCSLVVLDADDQPISVSPTGNSEQNVIVWMDHRAIAEAELINLSGHEVLRYVGGTISPEMETPKLLWLKRHLPEAWRRAARFLDLADFLTYRATGRDVRSACTTACKWTYLAHENQYRSDFFEQIGLGDLVEDGYRRIGPEVRPIGETAGALAGAAAAELGLLPGTKVGMGMIDAHAGGIGMLGAPLAGQTPSAERLEERVALIGGTSSCHMAVSRNAAYVPGIWGPYYSAMIPGLWLTEGGQSATGALLDHVIHSHARAAELEAEARARGSNVYALLNERIDALAGSPEREAELTRELHVLPDHHGNRSPRSDPTLKGVVSGLKLTDSVEQLAMLYLATVQALAHGTRHIIETMNAHGYRIDTVLACGGDTKNPKFVQAHADVTGCRVVLPREPEAVLLGAATLGAVASGDFPSLLAAMSALNAAGRIIEPCVGSRDTHAKKYAVFQKMHNHFMELRAIMR